MAKGKNALFKKNPKNFLRTHTLMVSPDAHMPEQKIPSPVAEIDLKPILGPKNPESVMMRNHLKATDSTEKESISAYYLPAIVDNTSTMKIGVGKPYFFTADLSGCLFAAYGPSDEDLTVEHVNVRTTNAAVSIAARAGTILAGGHAFCKVLSPTPIPGAVSYTTGGNVIGVLDPQGGWTFHYRVDGEEPKTL
jgi:hypothetical protein